MEEEYRYWEIHYISCEGNTRWTVARSSFDIYEDEVISNIQTGGCGDDISEIIEVIQISCSDYSIDI